MKNIASKKKETCGSKPQVKSTTLPNDDSLGSEIVCTSMVQTKTISCERTSQRISLDEYQGRNSLTDELAVDYESSSDECINTITPSCVIGKPGERIRSRTPSAVSTS